MSDLLQGTLNLLIFRALVSGEKHGLGIARRIEQMTNGTFHVKPGSLFPALQRLEKAGWLASSWGTSETNRRAKYYKLTKSGEGQLKIETDEWQRIAHAMANALRSA
ncbi:MAG TPA: PadR family transcriptional regulator [Bryobacteraceae bacterium]|nr:PadR family transcriptional regulator [Bryobacteraceae bacterium]